MYAGFAVFVNLACFFLRSYYQLKSFFMNLGVLMIGNDPGYLAADVSVLRQRGFRVYTSVNPEITEELVDEVKPDVIFINWQQPVKESTDLYHEVLDNIRFVCIPVVYTLAEDDVYLVNRKRTAIREKRNDICDNIVDAIKTALSTPSVSGRKRVRLSSGGFNDLPIAHRA